MALTLADAQKAAQAAQDRAKAIGISIAIAVVDDRGDLVVSHRMDGARWFMPEVARGKAFASATFRRPSSDLGGMLSNPFFQNMLHMQQGKMLFTGGAVPITQGGAIIGAVGISGGTGEQDEDCAKAGAGAV
jgi:uncharacterized protein GlcG (DUF336 family)